MPIAEPWHLDRQYRVIRRGKCCPVLATGPDRARLVRRSAPRPDRRERQKSRYRSSGRYTASELFATGACLRSEGVPEIDFRRAMSWRKTMRHEILIAGVAALAISAPALAESPTLLHHGFATYPEAAPATQPTTEVAQSQVPAYPPRRRRPSSSHPPRRPRRRPRPRRPRPRRTTYGSLATGPGTACNTSGNRENTSRDRLSQRHSSRATGSSIRTDGSGSRATGTTPASVAAVLRSDIRGRGEPKPRSERLIERGAWRRTAKPPA